MNKILYILLSISVVCNLHADVLGEIFQASIKAESVKVNERFDLNRNYELTRPQNVWITLVEFYYNNKKACLNYKIAREGEVPKPLLGLKEIGLDQECSKHVYKKDYWKTRLTIKHFGVWAQDGEARVLISDYKKKYHFPLLTINKINNDKKMFSYGYQLNDFPFNERGLSALKLVSKKIDSKVDEKFIADGQYCYKKNTDCGENISNVCQNCATYWLNVVDNTCPGYSKICASQRICGGKNEPACPRTKNIKADSNNLCFRGSTAGFCHKGLETHCHEDGYLVCL